MKRSPSVGICELCGERTSKAAMARHLASCAPSHDSRSGSPVELFQLRVEGKGAPMFWIDLEIKGDSPLRRLDELLRRNWLECCGHLSAFEVDGMRYSAVIDHEFDFNPNERSMNAKVSDVLRPGQRFSYEYDFGSTTELRFRVLDTRPGVIGKPSARLLARNEAPVWPCSVCDEAATLVCPYCLYEGESFCCAKHAPEHPCAAEEVFLPVVNSPRMGVCGYTGEAYTGES
jgi:hypothetical protein